jgi:hypothetical protein
VADLADPTITQAVVIQVLVMLHPVDLVEAVEVINLRGILVELELAVKEIMAVTEPQITIEELVAEVEQVLLDKMLLVTVFLVPVVMVLHLLFQELQ